MVQIRLGISLLVRSKEMFIQHLFTSLYKYRFDQYDQNSSQIGQQRDKNALEARSN